MKLTITDLSTNEVLRELTLPDEEPETGESFYERHMAENFGHPWREWHTLSFHEKQQWEAQAALSNQNKGVK
jgi:hypothetical protein